jgi:thioredoxin-like negative regulator of GroEL
LSFNKIINKLNGRAESMITKLESFEQLTEFMNSDKIGVVFFPPEWSGQSKMLRPVYEKFANAYSEKLIFAEVDQEEIILALQIGKSYPVFIVVQNGNILDKYEGVNNRRLLALALMKVAINIG